MDDLQYNRKLHSVYVIVGVVKRQSTQCGRGQNIALVTNCGWGKIIVGVVK